MIVTSATLYAHGLREPRFLLTFSPTVEWEVEPRFWLARIPGMQVSVPPSLRRVIEGHERMAAEKAVIVCTRCGDTHRMWHGGLEREVACTACPVPCPLCRADVTAYCSETPCPCRCHARSAQRNDVDTVRCPDDCPTADLEMEERS